MIKKRTKYTPNEIRINNEQNILEIDVYNSFGKYRATGYASLIDLEVIKSHKWYLDSTGYLRTTLPNGVKIRMHNLITGEKGIDHIDRNKLNNTRENLRTCTHWQNVTNCKRKYCKEIMGIYEVKLKNGKRYLSVINHNNKVLRKRFKNREEAVVQRFIWEINLSKHFSPQLEIISEKYPLMLLGLYSKPLKDDLENIHRIINYYSGNSKDCDFFETEVNVC